MLREEKETIINYDESCDRAQVYTFNGATIARLRKLAAAYPDDCIIVSIETIEGAKCVTARLPKEWVKINPPRQLSDEQKAARIQRLKRAN